MDTQQTQQLLGDPDRLTRWLEELPFTNVASAGRDLLHLLGQAGKVQGELAQRIEVGDRLAVGVEQMIERLRGELQHERNTANPKTFTLAQISEGLCLAFIAHYEPLTVAPAEASWLQLNRESGLRLTAAHRVAYYAFQILRIGRMLGRDAPDRLWLRLHRLYRSVSGISGVARKEISHPKVENYPVCSLDNLYKQCLLVQWLNLSGLGPGYCNEVERSIAYWASMIELMPCKGAILNRAHQRYVISDQDAGPQPFHQKLLEEPECHWIDVSKLDDALLKLFRTMHGDRLDSVKLPQGSVVSMTTLGLIKACWTMEGGANEGFSEELSDTGLEWLDALQLTDVRESSRQIYLHLRALNTHPMPLSQRYEAMSRLVEPCTVVFANLRKRYGEVAFPLPERLIRISGVLDDLAQMLADGWQLVLEEWQASSWLFKNTHPNIQRLAIYHIFHYSEILISDNLRLQQPVREGVWMRMHRLYIHASDEGTETLQMLPREHEQHDGSSVKRLYLRMLLLSLINMQAMTQEQIREVLGSMPVWASDLDIVKRNPKAEDNYPFYVNPWEDLPPASCRDICTVDDECLMLDVTFLSSRIAQLIKNAEADSLERVRPDDSVDREISVTTLRYLWAAWQHASTRKGDRKATNAIYQALFSMAASHYVLREGEAPEPVAKDASKPDESKSEQRKKGKITTEDVILRKDVWDTIMPKTELAREEEENWAPNADFSYYRFNDISIQDYSIGGCRFLFTPKPGQTVRIGDIVCMRREIGKDFLCGHIRWANPLKDGSLMIGLQFLSRRVEAVWLLTKNVQGNEVKLPVLLGDCVHTDKALLVLPVIPGIRRRKLQLAFANKHMYIYLAGLPAHQSQAFDCFRFGVLREGGKLPLVSEQQVTVRMLSELDLSSAPMKKKATGDSVWDLI